MHKTQQLLQRSKHLLSKFKVAPDLPWLLSNVNVIFDLRKMAAFMQLGRKRKVYKHRQNEPSSTHREEFRFNEENVVWMAEHFLKQTYETRRGALSNKHEMEVFLRYIGDPGFQLGVGKDIGIHQCTVSRTFTSVVEQIAEKAGIWMITSKGPRTHGRRNISSMHNRCPGLYAYPNPKTRTPWGWVYLPQGCAHFECASNMWCWRTIYERVIGLARIRPWQSDMEKVTYWQFHGEHENWCFVVGRWGLRHCPLVDDPIQGSCRTRVTGFQQDS